jgi:hypothetical protein
LVHILWYGTGSSEDIYLHRDSIYLLSRIRDFRSQYKHLEIIVDFLNIKWNV